jgi:hypothetical protein
LDEFSVAAYIQGVSHEKQKSTLSGAKRQNMPKIKNTPETGCACGAMENQPTSCGATVQHPANISVVITIASLAIKVMALSYRGSGKMSRGVFGENSPPLGQCH